MTMDDRHPGEPASVEELLARARARIRRFTPAEARAATRRGASLVDIRSDTQRAADGRLPGARCIPRNVLEWRLDPASPHRDPALARRGAEVIVICDDGYQSSLAAATLCGFGLRAADVAGGFRAWRDAGMPVEEGD